MTAVVTAGQYQVFMIVFCVLLVLLMAEVCLTETFYDRARKHIDILEQELQRRGQGEANFHPIGSFERNQSRFEHLCTKKAGGRRRQDRERLKKLEEELYAYRQEDARFHAADQDVAHLFDEAEQSVWDRARHRA